ncbi:methyltransferase domain-containing protein [soil metagenome]
MSPAHHTWDPERYLTYADERGRPFVELVTRVAAMAPTTVVDLGCGPGNLTRLLVERWPGARVQGLDSSPAMIDAARRDPAAAEIAFSVADLRDWHPTRPVDILVSNATLQWVDGHLDLLPRLVGAVAPGGWFAFQVPGNFTEPSHELRRELAAEAPYADFTGALATPSSHDPATYLRVLEGLGCEVDAWETTYLHVLSAAVDPDPVFTWVSATGARPTLEALPPELRERFSTEFKERLRVAYPAVDGRVVLSFRRVFAVARVAK